MSCWTIPPGVVGSSLPLKGEEGGGTINLRPSEGRRRDNEGREGEEL